MSKNGEARVLWLESHADGNIRAIMGDMTDQQRQALQHFLGLLSDYDMQKMSGALEIEPINDISDFLAVISDLNHFELYPDVSSERKLGQYLVESGIMRFPDSALSYLDYGRIGTEFRANHSGAYIDGGYVVRKDEMSRKTLDASRPQIFKLQLYAPQGVAAMTGSYCLTLPARPEGLELSKLLIGVTELSQAHIVRIECSITSLQRYMDYGTLSVELLNDLAIEIECLYASDNKLTDLCAILEAEQPETFERLLEVVRCYNNYEVLRHGLSSPEDYAKYILNLSKRSDAEFDERHGITDEQVKKIYGRMNDCIFEVELSAVHTTILALPAAPFKLLDALDRAHIAQDNDNHYTLEFLDSKLDYLPQFIAPNVSIHELNHLAQRLNELNQWQLDCFEGMVMMDAVCTEYAPIPLARLINMTHSMEECQVIYEVHDDKALGKFYVNNDFPVLPCELPEVLYEILDYAVIGRKARLDEGGVFTPNGYVVQNGEIAQTYRSGEAIPAVAGQFLMKKNHMSETAYGILETHTRQTMEPHLDGSEQIQSMKMR